MSRRFSPRSRQRLIGPILVLVLAGAVSCARSETLGPEEAVEVMVLDGVDRARAACIVDALSEQLDLAKITGLDVDLDDDELHLLATTSSRCAPALADGGVVAGPALDDPAAVAELAAAEAAVDIDTAVHRMVDQGLDPSLADCLIVRLSDHPDPVGVLDDELRFSAFVVDCRDELG